MEILKKLGIVFGSAAIIRLVIDLMQPKCRPRYGAKDRVVIVTGANSGIGYQAAKYLYKEGSIVIMACRNETKAKEAMQKIIKQCKKDENKGTLEFIKLDLDDFKSIHEFVNEINRRDLSIFSLINNAGVFQTSLHYNEYGFEQNFMVNHLGHQLLTDLLLPRIIKAGTELSPSKIVYVNSMLYQTGKIEDSYFEPFNKMTPEQFGATNMYSNSKLAQLLYARELAREVDYFKYPLYVNVASPGFTATNLSRHTPGYTWFKLLTFAPILIFILRTPKQGVQTILECVMANNRSSNGGFFRKCKAVPYKKVAEDMNLITKVYKLTRKAIGIQE